MNLVDELKNLHDLYLQGGLTNAEYAQAKARVLASAGAAGSDPTNDLKNEIANLRLEQMLRQMDFEWENEQRVLLSPLSAPGEKIPAPNRRLGWLLLGVLGGGGAAWLLGWALYSVQYGFRPEYILFVIPGGLLLVIGIVSCVGQLQITRKYFDKRKAYLDRRARVLEEFEDDLQARVEVTARHSDAGTLSTSFAEGTPPRSPDGLAS